MARQRNVFVRQGKVLIERTKMKRRSKWAKRCGKCGKILRWHNKFGLCSHHYKIKHGKERRIKYKKEGRCITCGKDVLPMILYPAGDSIEPVITFPVRCYRCRGMINKSSKKSHAKRKEKEKNEKATIK